MKKIILTGLLLSICLAGCKRKKAILPPKFETIAISNNKNTIDNKEKLNTDNFEKLQVNQAEREETDEFVLEDNASFNVFEDEQKKQVESGTSKDNLTWDDAEEDSDQKFEVVRFDYDSSEIKPSEKEKIVKNAAIIKPKLVNSNKKVKVKGHSCIFAKNEEYNYALSQERAQKVGLEYEKQGISYEHIKPVGFGKSMTLTDEEDMEAQAVNRRVETELI